MYRVHGLPNAFAVVSSTRPNVVYIVRLDPPTCTCPGFVYRGDCKHLRAVKERCFSD